MRKILSSICVLCAAMLCLTSCLKDKEKDYKFEYSVQANIATEDDWKTLEAYFAEYFINEAKTREIHATMADAYELGVKYYEQDLKTINQDLILDCIKDKDDIVILNGLITGDKVKEVIKATYWNYEYKQTVRPDPAE